MMAKPDRRRAELFQLLVPKVGRDATVGLIEALPPPGQQVATSDQLVALRKRMDERFETLEKRLDERSEALEQRLDDRIDGLRNELLAAFRDELVNAVSGQTRHVIVATATAVFGIGGLAVTLAQVL